MGARQVKGTGKQVDGNETGREVRRRGKGEGGTKGGEREVGG